MQIPGRGETAPGISQKTDKHKNMSVNSLDKHLAFHSCSQFKQLDIPQHMYSIDPLHDRYLEMSQQETHIGVTNNVNCWCEIIAGTSLTLLVTPVIFLQ